MPAVLPRKVPLTELHCHLGGAVAPAIMWGIAHAQGIRRWDDPRVSAVALAVPEKYAEQFSGVQAANRPDAAVVQPERITGVSTTWRTPAPLELYVDFETVSNLADDFSSLPTICTVASFLSWSTVNST